MGLLTFIFCIILSRVLRNRRLESFDPVVCFKMLLVGYLNNINNDHALLRYCTNCLEVRLFLGYDLHESVPWHGTI